jgi:hypothetical protein
MLRSDLHSNTKRLISKERLTNIVIFISLAVSLFYVTRPHDIQTDAILLFKILRLFEIELKSYLSPEKYVWIFYGCAQAQLHVSKTAQILYFCLTFVQFLFFAVQILFLKTFIYMLFSLVCLLHKDDVLGD